jgi:hypothetical protein
VYVLLATATACLTTPDASCRRVLTQVDQLKGKTPLLDLLRAHIAAQR